jgi:hypothetical protein
MKYVELIIEVGASGSVRARRQDGAQVYGRFDLSALNKDLIDVFDDWLRERKITRRAELEVLGSLLYETLFNGEVDQFFKQTLDGIKEPDRLRLQLVFEQDSAALAGIPWEFLYRPDRATSEGFFLSTHRRLVLSRYIPLKEDRQTLDAGAEQLRLLIVISQPTDLGVVLSSSVVDEIQKLDGVDIKLLKNLTVEEFVYEIETYAPHILHFMGHGDYDAKSNQGKIALVKEDHETAFWISDATFADYFESAKPRLVVLHACQGAEINLTNKFAGLAPQLIRRSIPAVVAMQYPVSNKTAIKFSQTFYRKLAEHTPVDGAVQEGRRQITMGDPDAYSSRDFGTPVLYMHSRDGLIMPAQK